MTLTSLYRFRNVREIGRHGENATYEADDDGRAVWLIGWKSPDQSEQTGERIERTSGAETFYHDGSYFLVSCRESGKSTVEKLQKEDVFSGVWVQPVPLRTKRQVKPYNPAVEAWRRSLFILAATMAIVFAGLSLWRLRQIKATLAPERLSETSSHADSVAKQRPEVSAPGLSSGDNKSDRQHKPILNSRNVSTSARTDPSKRGEPFSPSPNPPSILTFYAEPETVQAGQTVTLFWTTEGASNVRIYPRPAQTLASQGRFTDPVPLEHDTQYRLATVGTGQQAERSLTVHVNSPSPSISSFVADPAAIRQCDATVLRWSTEHASRIVINGEEQPLHANSRQVHPLLTTTYHLVADDAGGNPATLSTVVTVLPGTHRFGPPECGEMTWTGVLGTDGLVQIETTMRNTQSNPPGEIAGGLPHPRVKVASLDNFARVVSQPYESGRAAVSLESRKTGKVTLHLWWQHVN